MKKLRHCHPMYWTAWAGRPLLVLPSALLVRLQSSLYGSWPWRLHVHWLAPVNA